MPIRFASPVVGVKGDVYLPRRTWQLGLAWRRLTSNQFIVGHDIRNDLGPGGEASFVNTNSFILSAAYGIGDRLSIALNLPFATGHESRIFKDGVRHPGSSTGFGDLNVIATQWLHHTGLDPRGNLAIGLGVKAPTGVHTRMGDFWGASDTTTWYLDQSIQWGDGGWGIIFQTQGFQPVSDGSYFYFAGSYTANPKKLSAAIRPPPKPPDHWAVPDTWQARLGFSAGVTWVRHLSLSLGGQIDGTTRKDLFVGRDPGFRRPAIVGYLDPGVTLSWSQRTVTLNVPVRIYKDFRRSFVDVAAGQPGGGGLARYLIVASVSQRFGGFGFSAGRTPSRAPRSAAGRAGD